jgi:hypothetical protein
MILQLKIYQKALICLLEQRCIAFFYQKTIEMNEKSENYKKKFNIDGI